MLQISDVRSLDDYATMEELRNRPLYLAEAEGNFKMAIGLDDRSAALVCGETMIWAMSDVLARHLGKQHDELSHSATNKLKALKPALLPEAFDLIEQLLEIRNTFAHAPSKISFETSAINTACCELADFRETQMPLWRVDEPMRPGETEEHHYLRHMADMQVDVPEGVSDLPDHMLVNEDGFVLAGFSAPKDGSARSRYIAACVIVTYSAICTASVDDRLVWS